MTPKIDRCLTKAGLTSDERLNVELAVCQRFREHAPIHMSDVERLYLDSPWLQLVVMQHYGAPTRLLDWTKSPWIAAFFAVSADWEEDGYIYIFRRDVLEERLKDKIDAELPGCVWGPHKFTELPDGARSKAEANAKLFEIDTLRTLSKWAATFYCQYPHFPRLIAQQGLFTFASAPDHNHWETICEQLPHGDRWVLKISASTKPEILRQLSFIGLNGATLFPGIDGIGRSLEGFARAWHIKPRPSQFGSVADRK